MSNGGRTAFTGSYNHRQEKVEVEFGGSYIAACAEIVSLRKHRDHLRELVRQAKNASKGDA